VNQPKKTTVIEKSTLHPRNLHRNPYNFQKLCASNPALTPFVAVNKFNTQTIDFSNPEAVKALNKALLIFFYKIEHWDIPENYLCPPIPGRSDYIHYMADLLAENNNGKIPKGKSITVLDIGTGANCIYPILGTSLYNWNFIGTDIDPIAVDAAYQLIKANPTLQDKIEIRIQRNRSAIFDSILSIDERVDLTICNPPFHSSLEEAQYGTDKKWKNLNIKKDKKNTLNFGGQHNELWCEGGENAFVCKMVDESMLFKNQSLWFSTLISKKTTLPSIYYKLEKANALEIKTIDMAQGQKISRIVAWTFLTKKEQQEWKVNRWDKK